jgi:AcrR family transcriptional regulator
MTNVDENKNKVLLGASNLFLKFGFKSITMDDIARELGISKKTLYQHFADKNELVDQAIEAHLSEEKEACTNLSREHENPIDLMLSISETLSDKKKQINQSIIFDLKKYFKPCWDKLNRFRVEFIYNEILKNIKSGKSSGWYREDVNEDLVAKFYIHLVDLLINPDNNLEEKYNLKELQSEMLKYHLRGICTEKGLKYLNNHTIKTDK